MEPAADPVLASVADGVGRLTLNRPGVINALSYPMVQELTRVLEQWREDSEVAIVVLDGAGDRGFCAGGDVRELREYAMDGRADDARTFFRDEYRLNAMIARYPKPVVSIMDGITMGGGIGLGSHASIRVVTERSRLAMPETRIGFCPDVGGTWLLARAPGLLGLHLGLTGATMGPADALAAGFADAFVPSENIPHLLQALAERADPGSPAEIVLLFDESPAGGQLSAGRAWIDACYGEPTVARIIERLRERPEAEAAAAADELGRLSPTALTVSLAAIRAAGRAGSLEDALENEYRVAAWLIGQHDLSEGIRAQLVDKDRSPRWSPPDLASVAPDAGATALATDAPETVF